MSTTTISQILNKKERNNFFLIAGPCVVESEKNLFQVAEHCKKITEKLNIPYIFKASYRKANRSKINSFTGIGDDEALKLLEKVKNNFDLMITSDIHESKEVKAVSEVVDILQIPAFLSRQTDLLVEAAKYGKIVNVKKGQFMSAPSMKFVVEKINLSGNNNVLLTERGTFFGYSDLVVDFRSLPQMQEFAPVVLDITHSLQRPNQTEGVTGGNPQHIKSIARAGVAVGLDGIFLETHPDPMKALSDGANMLALDKLEDLLKNLININNK